MRLAPEGPRNVPVKLTKNSRPSPNGSPYATDTQPDWSPDGTQIAFASDRDGNNEIYWMRATDGANQVNLTNNARSDFLPAWQPLP